MGDELLIFVSNKVSSEAIQVKKPCRKGRLRIFGHLAGAAVDQDFTGKVVAKVFPRRAEDSSTIGPHLSSPSAANCANRLLCLVQLTFPIICATSIP